MGCAQQWLLTLSGSFHWGEIWPETLKDGILYPKTSPIVKEKARLLASYGGAQLQAKSCALDPQEP